MRFLRDLILALNCFLAFSQAQNFVNTDRRRSDRNYNSPNPYRGSAGLYTQPSYNNIISPSYRPAIGNYGTTSLKDNYRSSAPVKSYDLFYNSYGSSLNANNFKRDSSLNKNVKMRISTADAENAKFLGAENQENNYDSRTFHLKRHLKHKKLYRRFNGALINPCVPYGRNAGKSVTPPAKEQGRFLWDVNVHNYYPQSGYGLGCGGYGGFGGGGFGPGLLSDPIGPAYDPPGTGLVNFLSLFAPGILQNSLAVTAPPQQFADYSQTLNDSDLQSDPEVDPNYNPGPASVPVRRPNRVFYDSAGAPPVTPGQLVGGISTTVNGIIQQLTGNVQPVYG